MFFLKKNIPDQPNDIHKKMHDNLNLAQHNLFIARRRVIGSAVLLTVSFAFLPWILDDIKRPWSDDIILQMPKIETPYKPNKVSKINNTNHLITPKNTSDNTFDANNTVKINKSDVK